jgi:regulator of protease activity HflC (stomatin/prohibitin superfamily)
MQVDPSAVVFFVCFAAHRVLFSGRARLRKLVDLAAGVEAKRLGFTLSPPPKPDTPSGNSYKINRNDVSTSETPIVKQLKALKKRAADEAAEKQKLADQEAAAKAAAANAQAAADAAAQKVKDDAAAAEAAAKQKAEADAKVCCVWCLIRACANSNCPGCR